MLEWFVLLQNGLPPWMKFSTDQEKMPMHIPRPKRKKPTAPAQEKTHRQDWSATNRQWTTADEVDFLGGLGRHLWSASVRTTRPVLLGNYLACMPHRADWGSIDAHTVRAACVGMIEEGL